MTDKLDAMMEKFLEEPELELHIRELAKSLRISPTTVGKYADALEKRGMLQKRKVSNHIFMRAADTPMFKAKRKEWNLRRLQESGIVGCLEEELNHPEAIIAYGSYAKGEDSVRSDIDLAVITPLKKEPPTEKFSQKLKHPIHLLAISREDIENMKEKNKELLNSLINGTIISGFWEAFT